MTEFVRSRLESTVLKKRRWSGDSVGHFCRLADPRGFGLPVAAKR